MTCVDCGTSITDRPKRSYLCLACYAIRHRTHDSRWHRENGDRHRAAQARFRARVRARTKLVCQACGSRRERGKRYCEECRKAFREYSKTAYRNRQSITVDHPSFVLLSSSSSKSKREPLKRLKLKDLPLDIEWWNARLIQFPHLDIDEELSKAQDWYKADQIKSPKLFFRNWLEKAARHAPPQELTADQVRARLRIVS